MHRHLRILLLVGVLLALTTGSASARPPAGLTLGFSADPVLTTAGDATRATWIPRAVSEGAQIVRVNVVWSQVAPAQRPAGFDPANPASPGYDWSQVDAMVRDLATHGLAVLANVWGAPTWAENGPVPGGVHAGAWRPDAAQFAAFATAVARRYSGSYPDPDHSGASLPRVIRWQVWNEPNLDYYLAPQWTLVGNHYVPQAATIYRNLLNAFYSSVKAVSPQNFVVAAGTAPYGDDPGVNPVGRQRTPPVRFDRELFCLASNARLSPLRGCASPAHLDALSHHPYSLAGPLWQAFNADDAAVADIHKLARVLRRAEQVHHVLPPGRKALWATEISWDSKPPDPGAVPINRQARWAEQSFYELWRQGVSTVLWLRLADSPPIPSYSQSYQAGVFFIDGTPKPTATAYRFPFVAVSRGRRHVRAWGLAPVGGRLRIERLRHGRWVALGRGRVRRRAVFFIRLRTSPHGVFRAQIGGQTSLSWTLR